MNILVVDDEPLIHISIERLIKSVYPDAGVIHAYNGREMLVRLSEEDFIMAYVDIKMPGLTGLEALKQARELAPFTRYFIMTGFDEFEYAKQAIKLKVDDYLMKPLDISMIKESIELSLQYHQKHMEHKKNVFRNALENTVNNRECYFNEFAGHYCCLLLVNVDTPELSPDSLPPLFQHDSDTIVSLFTGRELLLMAFSESYDSLRGLLRELAAADYPDGMTAFAASITSEPAELRETLALLKRCSSLRVILGTNRFYHLSPLTKQPGLLLDFCQNCILWQTAYQARDYTLFGSQSSLICSQLSRHKELKAGLNPFMDFAAFTLNSTELVKPNNTTDIDLNQLNDILQKAARELLSQPADNKVQTIIQYIREHYQENLSAADLSSRFGLSANYISNLLKNTLGIRYNDYVTQLRLNRAKELLISTHQSIKDITEECGYFSQSHFNKLFIKHEGCTPAEYRKNHIR